MNSQHSQQSSVSSSIKTFSTVSTTATIVSTYWTILELLESDPINLQLLESLCNELFELRIRNKLNSEIKEVIDELRGAYNSRLGGIKLDFQARIIPEYIEQKNSIDDEEENGTVEHDDQGNAEGLEKELEDEWLSPIIISDTDAKNEMEKSVEALAAEAFTLKIVEAKNRLSSVIFEAERLQIETIIGSLLFEAREGEMEEVEYIKDRLLDLIQDSKSQITVLDESFTGIKS